MTKTSLKVRDRRPTKFSSRAYTHCERCERSHSVYRKSGSCRVCLKDLAHKGQILGLEKASW